MVSKDLQVVLLLVRCCGREDLLERVDGICAVNLSVYLRR